jgi:hypothetical protein
MPSKSYFASDKRIYIKKVKAAPKNKSSSDAQKSQQFMFSFTFLCITVSLFFLGFYGEQNLIPVKQYCSHLENMLLSHGFIQKKGLILEAFIATVCWSSTYLFIRRLWNPETFATTFEKYAADSFFGGLAAGASVLMKSALTKALA